METVDTTIDAPSEIRPFEFTGKAGEYFSIWIVNVLLTILTLGIYSAWAKVRTNQYFYGNTYLDGNTFRYLADPKQILKGRLIAAALFAAYYFSGLISPTAAVVSVLIIVILVPALIVMSMSFQLRNTAYRNIKFNFEKNFKRAYTIFFLPMMFIGAYLAVLAFLQPEKINAEQNIPGHLLVLISALPLVIALMYPWWEFMVMRFKVDHADFGTSDFKFSARTKDYYALYLKASLIFTLAFFLIFILMFLVSAASASDGSENANANPIAVVIMVSAMVIIYFWMFAYIQTKRTNLVFSNIDIEGHKLTSNLSVRHMLYLYITNTLAMALTLGLMMPWAKIRTARYRASMTAIRPSGDFDGFINAQSSKQSALGEEMGEFFDLDLGM